MQRESLSDARVRVLVEEIRDGVVLVESDWLEWKRSLDFSSTEGRFPLPKNVLGMANRMPETALRNLGGYGYILVGAEPGSIVGVNHMDPAQLHDWIDPYIGATGPSWQLRSVRVDDKTVAVIEVAPPRPGDPIYTLRKECDGFQRGTIFVRKNGKTCRADDQDVENLIQRAKHARLDLDLLLIGAERMSWFNRSAVEAEITRIADLSRDSQLERARAYGTGGETEVFLSQSFSSVMDTVYGKEQRSLDKYESEVNKWHTQWIHKAPQHWVESYMLAGYGVYSLRLRNLTDQNFASLEVRLHIEGVQIKEDIPLEAVGLPDKPRQFGKGASLFDIGRIDSAMLMPRVNFTTSFDSPEFSVIQIDRAVEVVWNAGDLRPAESVGSSELCILVDAPGESGYLAIGWSATSTNINGVFEGVKKIPLVVRPTLFDDFKHDLHD